MGIGRILAAGAFSLASLISCAPEIKALAFPPETTQKTEGERLTFRRENLENSGKYKGMTLWINIGEDNVCDAAVLTDLRSVVNILPDEKRMIDFFSFSSMIQRGSLPETTYITTDEAAKKIANSSLEERLRRTISPSIPRKIASKDYPKVEPEEKSIRIKNSSPLIAHKKNPETAYYFSRPILTTEKIPKALSKEEAQKIDSFGDRVQLFCPAKLKGAELKRYEQDQMKYADFSVKPIFIQNVDRADYSCAGLGLKFDGSGDYDVVGILDLRAVRNPREINENDLQAMAFWGDIKDTYATSEAAKLIKSSRYLQKRLGSVFTPNTKPKSAKPSSAQEEHVRLGKLEELLPLQTAKQRLYFHPPEISACKN